MRARQDRERRRYPLDPELGGKWMSPESGGSTAAPASGGKWSSPESGGSTAAPESGRNWPSPEAGGSPAAPTSASRNLEAEARAESTEGGVEEGGERDWTRHPQPEDWGRHPAPESAGDDADPEAGTRHWAADDARTAAPESGYRTPAPTAGSEAASPQGQASDVLGQDPLRRMDRGHAESYDDPDAPPDREDT